MTEHYDVIIVGSGAGGGTLAHTLARSGRRILLLERGDFLTRETDNWDPGAVFVDGEVVGTWRPKASGRKLTVAVTTFAPLPPSVGEQIEAEAARVASVRGLDLAGVARDG